jgi:hypothetical protein
LSVRVHVEALLTAAILLSASALAAPPSAPAAEGGASAGAHRIAAHGFGDRRNSYAWSAAWFRGGLYVGTARSALCVEGATLAYWFPGGGFYRRRPVPGVRCPSSIHRADLRAEIWRWRPGDGWRRVQRSPRTVRDRLAPRGRMARDVGYRGMVVRREGRRRVLYVAALGPGEFLPGSARRSPPRLLRSTDGRRFEPVRGRLPVIRTRVGPRRAVGFRSLQVHRGRLYVTASAGLTGDGVVLRVDRAAGRRARFTQVSPPALAVFELATFAGRLYAGTGDQSEGYGVWQAHRPGRARWAPVVTGGAGRGATMTSVVSMAPFKGRLYVGASGWHQGTVPGSELVRLDRRGALDVVVGATRTDGAGAVRAPLSGLPDGFGNPYNAHFWRMSASRGALYVGTNDVSWSSPPAAAEAGFDLYGSCDGSSWWTATRDGYGDGLDFGARTLTPSPRGLFVGTTNHVQGATVVKVPAPRCGRRAVAAAAVPATRPPAPPAARAWCGWLLPWATATVRRGRRLQGTHTARAGDARSVNGANEGACRRSDG